MAEKNEQLELDLELEPAEGSGVYVDDKGSIVEQDERLRQVPEKQKPLISPDDDEREEQEDQDEAEEVARAHTEEDREAIRERRRKERKLRKIHQRERLENKDRLIASLQRQVQDMSARIAQAEQRQVGFDISKLDRDLQEAIDTANEAKEHLRAAAESADGEGVANATELYYAARRKAEYLAGIKQNLNRAARQPAPVKAADPELKRHADDWMRRNPWFDLNERDEDSKIAKVIDNQLAAEGYDPRTKEYWDELDDRLSARLPHRYSSSNVNGSGGTRRSVVSGSGKNSGTSSGNGAAGKFYLSADRVKAMKDAGIWDQPDARAKMVEAYRRYDKENKR